MEMNRNLLSLAVIGFILVLSGCATTGNFNALKSRVDALEADLRAVRTEAATARNAANDAVNTANRAMDKANEANARSIETETKIDRMFKRAMHK